MWKRLMSVLLVVLLCCPIFAVRAEKITANGRVNRALLVGCDRFLTQTDTTPSSRNNVLRMADALSGGTLNMQTIVTREEGLSSASALIALIRETFADADADDVSYFYISTHGLWNTAVNGLMTLLLSDGESEEGITAYELRRVFDTIPGKKVLLLDACHSGAMIGKGVEKSFENLFAGDNYYVVCSSGGEEESWYWSGEVGGERLAGSRGGIRNAVNAEIARHGAGAVLAAGCSDRLFCGFAREEKDPLSEAETRVLCFILPVVRPGGRAAFDRVSVHARNLAEDRA